MNLPSWMEQSSRSIPQPLCLLFVTARAWGIALVWKKKIKKEIHHIPKPESWMKEIQCAVSFQCTWRQQRSQHYPLTLVPFISNCTFHLLFPLHFSHVLSYMISLEPDKTPSEGFCSWGHRPGSVSGLQLLTILSLRRLEDCEAWGTPHKISCPT